MADFIFRVSPNIVLSSYGVTRLGQYASEYGSKYIVIMDPILKEVAISNKITQALESHKIDFFVFDEFSDGSNTQSIERALTLAREGHVHGVIACGGGKAMHVGQAVAALFNEKRDLYDFIDGEIPTCDMLNCICVPTTIREVFLYTPFLPVIDSRSRQVKILRFKKPVCKLALIDTNLISMLTENQKTAMAMETLCLAGEAYLSQKANFFSDMLSEKAMELLSLALDGSSSLEITTPTDELLMHGGCMASLASAVSAPGACTILSMAINARFRISTSLVSSILFPHFFEDAVAYKSSRIEKLAHLFRIEATDDMTDIGKMFAENIRMRLAKMNLPVRLKDLSVPIDDLALAVEDAGQLTLMSSLSRSMTTDDLFAMVKAAY